LDILRRLGQWRVNWRWYVFILFSPAVIYFLAVGVHVLLGGTAPQFPLLRENQQMILMAFIFFLLPWQSSAFLEEIGFRGYALEKVQNKFGPLVGTLILGGFFGAWLLPEFFQPDSFQFSMGGLRFYPWFILTEIGWSLLMTWVYNKTGKSSLIAGYLFHAAFNTWPLILLTNAIPGEAPPAFDTTLFIVAGVVVALAGVVVLVATKGQLGFSKEES
jgi:membrane protease YdiL (CAAX protease family)